ncbi:MAG TPA: hypothetical protein VKB80_31080 [Kofleriaceae bacterium]|nr:hypothetical protein [Kofleriaceae bacterium]
MKTVALAAGGLDTQERALIDGAQRWLGSELDVDALAPITPEELAGVLLDPKLRRQLIMGLILLSMADGEASREESDAVESFARALEVDAHEVATLRRLSEGRLLMARLDVLRRFWVRPLMMQHARAGGVRWVIKTMAAFAGLREDTELADRYRALADYPEGTMGRAYADFILTNGFSFPGEKGSGPEPIVFHDLTHVLSGYGTDPTGEICVTAFSAGFRKEEPFTFLLFSMMQFNLGIGMTPVAPATKNQFDAPRALTALQRGARMNIDLSDGTWDYWSDMASSLEMVRAKYGVPPLRE